MRPRRSVLFRATIILFIVVFLPMGCRIDLTSVPAEPNTPNIELDVTSTQTVFVTLNPTTVPTLTAVGIGQTTKATPTVQSTMTPEMPVPIPQATTQAVATLGVAEPITEADPELYPYGAVYAYSKNDWSESDRQSIREQLAYLQGLGVNTIVQIFYSRLIGTGRERDWLIFLDEAERIDMQVIARLWPLDDWTGLGFDFQPIARFLAVVQDHPALLAYLGLHEPLEKYNSDQMRAFYKGVKSLAPDLPIANYMGNMAWFEQSARFPNRDFTTGICDICIVWYTPAYYQYGKPVFDEALFREVLSGNRQLVDERAPDNQLWALGQSYSQAAHRDQLRMPTPAEMEWMFVIAMEERMDGFLWYPWFHGSKYDQVLGDPDMDLQREAVRHIYDRHILEKSTP